MINDNDKEFDKMKIFAEFKEFATESNNFFSKTVLRIKDDRNFAGGGQSMWNDNDTANRGKGRAQVPYNFLENYVNAICNPFKKSPYQIKVTPKGTNNPITAMLNDKVKSIESKSNAKSVWHSGVKDSVTAGYGYVYVTTEQDEINEDDSVDIMIRVIDDATMVLPDPFSKDIDGKDSEQLACVEYVKKSKAKQLYGDDVVGDTRSRMPYVADFGSTWKAPEGSLALVTYFKRKRTDIPGSNRKKITVEYFKMIGDSIIDKGELDCPYIPIVPMKGSEIFRDNAKTFVGIIDKAKPVQKQINYALSQLRERLAKAPKPLFWTTKETIEGQESYFENMDKNMNPLIVVNGPTKDAPSSGGLNKIDNSIITSDLGGVIDSNINYMSLIIGTPSTGLVGSLGENETAESVLMRSKSSESNQSHFYENAKASIKHVGRILLYFIKQVDPSIEFNVNDFEIQVSDGPELITARIEQRKDLLAFSQTLPENMKPLVSKLIAKTLDIDESDTLAKEIELMLPPELKPNIAEDPAAKQIMDQMSSQLDAAMNKSNEYMSVIAQLQQQVLALEEDSSAQIQIAQMNNLTKLKSIAMQEEGKDKRLSAEIIADAEKDLAKFEVDLATKRHENEVKRQQLMTTPIYSMSKGVNRL